MQWYGVRRTHAESENKFNVTVQLKASKAAVAALESRWEWSRLQPSRCYKTGGQTHIGCTKFGSFFAEISHRHIFILVISHSVLLQTPASTYLSLDQLYFILY